MPSDFFYLSWYNMTDIQQNARFFMKRYQIPKSSFLYKFSMRFLLLILIPVIVGWLIFIEAMNYFYVDNLLTAQQISMEKSLSSL